jgi:hypothetical protein
LATELGQRYEITWRGRYPHMLDEDIPVWNRFLDKFAQDFKAFYYDVRVSGEDVERFLVGDKWDNLAYKLLAYRIDAIGEKENEIWIIEVTTKPGPRTLGQMIFYYNYWMRDPKIKKPVSLHVVCENIMPDILDMLQRSYIIVHIL